jgi:hypothetical protein
MANMEENCENIRKIWKKAKLNSEKICKIQKKSGLNSQMVWKVWKTIVKWYEKYGKYWRTIFFYKAINTACILFKITLCPTVRGNNSVIGDITLYVGISYNSVCARIILQ